MSGFSLINSKLSMFQLPSFCYKNSYIFQFLLYLFGSIPQGDLRGCLPSLSPQQVCKIEHNSHLLGCAFFFSIDTSWWFFCAKNQSPSQDASSVLIDLGRDQKPQNIMPGVCSAPQHHLSLCPCPLHSYSHHQDPSIPCLHLPVFHHQGLSTSSWLCQPFLVSMTVLGTSSMLDSCPPSFPHHLANFYWLFKDAVQAEPSRKPSLTTPTPIQAQWPLAPTASYVFFCLFFCASHQTTWQVTHFTYLCTTKDKHTHSYHRTET